MGFIRAIFIFIGAYIVYSICYAAGLGKMIAQFSWANQVNNLTPASLYGFGVVLIVTWLVCRK